jgi:hypothetical protein
LMYVTTRWFKYDRDWLCVNKSQFVPVIFEPPCMLLYGRVIHCWITEAWFSCTEGIGPW